MKYFHNLLCTSAALILSTITACNQNNPTDTITETSKEDTLCDLVSTEEISSVLGIPGLPEQKAEVYKILTTCSYESNNTGTYYLVQIDFKSDISRSSFDDERNEIQGLNSCSTPQDVTGIGDSAYHYTVTWTVLGMGVVPYLSVLSGNKRFTILATHTTLEKEKELAALIISRLSQ